MDSGYLLCFRGNAQKASKRKVSRRTEVEYFAFKPARKTIFLSQVNDHTPDSLDPFTGAMIS